jgi:hypothetical protein
MDLREIGWGVMDWIDLVGDGDQWPAVVKTIMDFFGFRKMFGKFLITERLAASPKRSAPWSYFCSAEGSTA